MMMALSRRRYLKLVGATCVGALGWLVHSNAIAQAATPKVTALRLVGVLPHQESPRAVGRRYLQQAPDEASVDLLLSRLAPPRQGRKSELARFMAERIRNDFTTRRVVSVDGWILAESEARLFALAALL